MKLTVCICTISGREDSLKRLVNKLTLQAEGKDVQVLWLGDNRKWTLGKKRMMMYFIANDSEYISFVDDDDDVSEDYVDTLLEAIEQNNGVDLINFKMQYEDRATIMPVYFSSRYENQNFVGHYERQSHTLMCWRWAALHGKCYPDVTLFEDAYFAAEAAKRVTSEVSINKTLYYYKFDRENSTQPK